jgi:deazaflavin-dependent oxidoreductase (nitroreductase family)
MNACGSSTKMRRPVNRPDALRPKLGGMVKEKPGRLLALLNRAPIPLYRAHLGWVLGTRLLMLTTTGRKSGRTRRTVVEVVKRADGPTGANAPTLWVIASRGPHSDWYANAVAAGPTHITWMTRSFTPRVHALDTDERVDLLADYQRHHPRAATMLGKAALGEDFTADPEGLRRLAGDLRALRFEPPSADVGAGR